MNFSSYPTNKSKNFGYTFSIIFLLIFLYFFFNGVLNYAYLLISLFLTLVTILKPRFLGPLSFYWDKFGLLVGRFATPLILCFVYITTIIPTKIVLQIFFIDLLKKKKMLKLNLIGLKEKIITLISKSNFSGKFFKRVLSVFIAKKKVLVISNYIYLIIL